MATIRIRDLKDEHLAFDLADLLAVLGQPALRSTWMCAVDWCIARDGARPNLESAYNASRITGHDISALASETLQVIDGTFEAFHPGQQEPWLKLEAIDSSYWEVFATDPSVLSPFKMRFSNVEAVDERAV